jgi:hypothetical protein
MVHAKQNEPVAIISAPQIIRERLALAMREVDTLRRMLRVSEAAAKNLGASPAHIVLANGAVGSAGGTT